MRVIGKRGGRADYHLKGAPFDVEACCLVKDHSVWGTAVRKKPRFGYLGPVRALEHAQSKVQLWREVTRVINFLILTWGPSQMIPWCLGSMKLPKKSIFSTLTAFWTTSEVMRVMVEEPVQEGQRLSKMICGLSTICKHRHALFPRCLHAHQSVSMAVECFQHIFPRTQ